MRGAPSRSAGAEWLLWGARQRWQLTASGRIPPVNPPPILQEPLLPFRFVRFEIHWL